MSSYVPIYAVDFDGTLCESQWPGIGAPNTKLIEHLIKRQKEGAKIILWTCRIEDRLQEAVDWSAEHGLIFDAVNDNLPENVEKYGNNCRKIWATCYIDDLAVDKEKYGLPFHADRGENEHSEETANYFGMTVDAERRVMKNCISMMANAIDDVFGWDRGCTEDWEDYCEQHDIEWDGESSPSDYLLNVSSDEWLFKNLISRGTGRGGMTSAIEECRKIGKVVNNAENKPQNV